MSVVLRGGEFIGEGGATPEIPRARRHRRGRHCAQVCGHRALVGAARPIAGGSGRNMRRVRNCVGGFKLLEMALSRYLAGGTLVFVSYKHLP